MCDFHIDVRGFASIGYHWVIRMGVLYYVGDAYTQRAHTLGRNHEALGVCFAGNYEHGASVPASEDVGLFLALYETLAEWSDVPLSIMTHREMLPGHTKCPGEGLQYVIDNVRAS